jgi:hypothetical protein
MAVMTQRTATKDKPRRVLLFLAAVWIAVSLAVGGSAMPSGDQGSPAQAAARDATGP